MKKSIIALVVVMTMPIFVAAQQFKLEYDDKSRSLPDVMRQYLDMQGVQSMSVTMKGDFNGKRGKIKKVTCDNGEFSEKELLSEYMHFVLVDSVETLDFMVMPKDGKLLLTCNYPEAGYQLFCDTLDLDKGKILMETYTADSETVIPIMAYTSGIKIDSEIGTMIWFCGLRDSAVAPRQWHDEHNIESYVYYTISLEEDTPPGDNDPIYVKVAKKDAGAFHRH